MVATLPDPPDDASRRARAAPRLVPATRWLLALSILLVGLAAWLETTAPAHPLPALLASVAASGLLCGAAPGVCVALGAGLALWWFALRIPGEPLGWPIGEARTLLTFAALSALLLLSASLLRRRIGRAD